MSAAPGIRPNPYIGPRAFKRHDSHLFYGRERDLRKLLNLIIAERIVLLHSPSGAGKSSLINAALIPALEEEKFRVLPVMRVNRVLPPTASANIKVANRYVFSALLSLEECLPKKLRTPLEKLAEMSLAQYLEYMRKRREKVDIRERLRLWEALRAGDSAKSLLSKAELDSVKTRSLIGDSGIELIRGMDEDEARELREMNEEGVISSFKEERRRTPTALIFDQFEEVLSADSTDQQAKHEFFRQAGEALYDDMVWAVFSMREDYVAALQPYLRPVPTRLGTRFRLSLLTIEHALDAIRKPANEKQVDFSQEAADKLVDDLRTVKVQGPMGIATDEKGDFIEPMQLQVVCYRLWQKLQFPDGGERKEIKPEDLKGSDVNQALAGFYEDCVRQVAGGDAAREKQVRDWVQETLITPGGTRGMVYMGQSEAGGLPKAVVEKLQNLYLLRSELRAGAYWFELTHDRFIGPIRESNRTFTGGVILAERASRARVVAAVLFLVVAVLWIVVLESLTPATVQQVVEREKREVRLYDLQKSLTLYQSKVMNGPELPPGLGDPTAKRQEWITTATEFRQDFNEFMGKYCTDLRAAVEKAERQAVGDDEIPKGHLQRHRRGDKAREKHRLGNAVPKSRAAEKDTEVARMLTVAEIDYRFLKGQRRAEFRDLYSSDMATYEEVGEQMQRAEGFHLYSRSSLTFIPITCSLLLPILIAFLTANRAGIVNVFKEVLKGSPDEESDEGDSTRRTSNWLTPFLRPNLGTASPYVIRDALGWNVASPSADIFTLASLVIILLIQARIVWVGAEVLNQLWGGAWAFGLSMLLAALGICTVIMVNRYLRTGLRQAYAAGGGKGESK